MKKVQGIAIFIAMLSIPLVAQDIVLTGSIVSTHDEAGGGYGIQTSKGVYGACYVWDNPKIVKTLENLEPTGKTIKIKGKKTGKWDIACDSLVFLQK